MCETNLSLQQVDDKIQKTGDAVSVWSVPLQFLSSVGSSSRSRSSLTVADADANSSSFIMPVKRVRSTSNWKSHNVDLIAGTIVGVMLHICNHD